VPWVGRGGSPCRRSFLGNSAAGWTSPPDHCGNDFWQSVYQKLSDTFHFDGEMLFVAAKKGMRIREIPIPTHYGDEKSHLNPITYGFTVLGIMFKYLTGKYKF